MRCDEAQELITGLVDNELTDAERSSIESHLKDCSRCQVLYREEQALKRGICMAGAGVSAPADLREKILSNRRIFPERAISPKRWEGLLRPSRFLLRPAFVLALGVFLALPTLYLVLQTGQSISLTALEMHEKIVRGETSLVKARSQAEVRERLSRSVEGRFTPMGYDLSMMNLQPVGGVVRQAKGRKILATVYEGKGASLTCYTFLGTEEDAPANATIFLDPEKKINFYTFSRGEINGVLHREGKVICILVSKMPMQDLLAIARSKAQPSSPF
jgi:hypothetical protein